VSIDRSTEQANASSTTITNADAWGVSIAGAGYDSSTAVSGTGIYEVTVGAATSYEGTIGDIKKSADYAEFHYDFGLFVYEFAHPAGPHFQVINYWTSNFGPLL
jgi:hypothetical protein